MSHDFAPEALRKLALTLAVGVAGGAAFLALGLPVPWLSGPAVAVACVSIAGVDLSVPRWLRDATLVFLGATMGAAVTPDTLTQVARWPLSLAGLAVCVFCTMSAISFYLERVHGYDRATARLSAVPGALPYVLALATKSSGDQRRIAIIQMVRLTVLLVGLPSVLTLLGLKTAAAAAAAVGPVRVHELVLLMAGGRARRLDFRPVQSAGGGAVRLHGRGGAALRLGLDLIEPAVLVDAAGPRRDRRHGRLQLRRNQPAVAGRHPARKCRQRGHWRGGCHAVRATGRVGAGASTGTALARLRPRRRRDDGHHGDGARTRSGVSSAATTWPVSSGSECLCRCGFATT